MLKLTYTESSFYLECLTLSLEEWVAQRVIFSPASWAKFMH